MDSHISFGDMERFVTFFLLPFFVFSPLLPTPFLPFPHPIVYLSPAFHFSPFLSLTSPHPSHFSPPSLHSSCLPSHLFPPLVFFWKGKCIRACCGFCSGSAMLRFSVLVFNRHHSSVCYPAATFSSAACLTRWSGKVCITDRLNRGLRAHQQTTTKVNC